MEHINTGGDRSMVGTGGPCTHLCTVTPGNDEFDPPLRFLRVENAGGGTLVVVAANDTDEDVQTFTLAQYGVIEGVAIKKVLATSTASTIIGGW